MERTVIYTRVSTEQQASCGVSLAAQEEACRTYAEAHGLGPVEVISDAGFSGRTLDRPGIREVIRRAEAGEIDHCIVYALDRLSRKTSEATKLVGETLNGAVGFHSTSQAIDTSTPGGQAFAGMLAVFSQLESDMVSARTREAAEQCFREGRVFGGTPYGYAVADDGKTLVPHPDEAPIMERIRRERESGLSYNRIAEGLNADSIPTKRGGRWYSQTVKSVLTRKRNSGEGTV